jgi:membrane protein DedA with SNARE-associated domain
LTCDRLCHIVEVVNLVVIRRAVPMEAFVFNYIAEFTYIGIFTFLMLTVFGFPFPEDAVLLLGGVVVSKGITSPFPTLIIALIGVIIGDMILYYIGRKYGRRLVNHRRFGRVLTKRRLRRARVWFKRWGNPLVFFGRHLVGVRAQIFLCSGVFKLHPGRVLAYDTASAAIGVPLMLGLGYVFGNNLPYIKDKVMAAHWAVTLAVAAAVASIAVYTFIRKRRAPSRALTP